MHLSLYAAIMLGLIAVNGTLGLVVAALERRKPSLRRSRTERRAERAEARPQTSQADAIAFDGPLFDAAGEGGWHAEVVRAAVARIEHDDRRPRRGFEGWRAPAGDGRGGHG